MHRNICGSINNLILLLLCLPTIAKLLELSKTKPASMASVSCSAPLFSFRATLKPCTNIANSSGKKICCISDVFQNSRNDKVHSFTVKAAAGGNRNIKPNSVICGDCDGNGAVQCSQCKGSGVNSVDLFNGQFKAGDSCWLCGGKKHMLCGNCNGAGFVGGFMSTYDE